MLRLRKFTAISVVLIIVLYSILHVGVGPVDLEATYTDHESIRTYTAHYNSQFVDLVTYKHRKSDAYFYSKLDSLYPVITDQKAIDWNRPRVIHEPKNGCPWIHGVVMIKVRRNAEGRREMIREMLSSQGIHFLIFVLGEPSSSETGDEVAKQIALEIELYDDIVIGDFPDNYEHIRSKEYFKLWYYAKHCRGAQMFSLDDDVIPKWHHMEFEGPVICYTSLFSSSKPMRALYDKWFISYEDYALEQYPVYCDGKAFSVGKNAAVSMVHEAERREWVWKLGTCGDAFSTGVYRVLGKVPVDGRSGGKFISHVVSKIEANIENYTKVAKAVRDGVTLPNMTSEEKEFKDWAERSMKWVNDLIDYHSSEIKE